MDDIKIIIRRALLAIPVVVATVGTRIFPAHISQVGAPVYPAISLYTGGEESMDNRLAYNRLLQIDLWLHKDGFITGLQGNDALWYLYKPIRKALNNKPLIYNGLTVFSCRQTAVEDDLYEQDTGLYHLAARYKIIWKGEL